MPRQKELETKAPHPALLDKKGMVLLGGGCLLIAVGYLLMLGGAQPPVQWNPDEIYSFRRITLSTLFVIGGMVVVLLSIFLRQPFATKK